MNICAMRCSSGGGGGGSVGRATMASERVGKRRKRELKRLTSDENFVRSLLSERCSVTSLKKILSKIRARGSVPNVSSEAIDSIPHAHIAGVLKTTSFLLSDGTRFDWEWLDPSALISYVLEECPPLAEAYGEAARRHEPTIDNPWEVVLTFDEVIPGNKFKKHNMRKSMNLAMNFIQMDLLLYSDATWFLPVVVRSTYMNKVPGCWPRMLGVFMRSIMCDPASMAEAGIPLLIDGQPLIIFGKISDMVTDGDAFRLGWSVFSSTALKACQKCRKTVRKHSGLAGLRGGWVETTCHDHAAFDLATANDFYEATDECNQAQRDFESGALNKTNLKKFLEARGIHPNHLSWTSDLDLRRCVDAIGIATDDWVHCFLQDGVVLWELRLYLEACSPYLPPNAIERFFASSWKYPRRLDGKIKNLAELFRASDWEVKPQASEMLSLYSLLRHFSEVVIGGIEEISAQRASFEASCECVDLVMRLKSSRLIDRPSTVERLKVAVSELLRLHKLAYGETEMKPKHHRSMHLPDQMQHIVLDAFLIERMNNLVRQLAETIHGGRGERYEWSILSGVLNTQLRRLNGLQFGNFLKGPLAYQDDAMIADHMEFHGRNLSVDDVVRHQTNNTTGLVLACCEEFGEHYVLVDRLLVESQLSAHSLRASRGGYVEVWHAAETNDCDAWYFDGNAIVVLYM